MVQAPERPFVIAAVVPCVDAGRRLQATIGALSQARPPDEIVVVDVGSSDLYTRQFLANVRGDNLRVHRMSRVGRASSFRP